jgi:hypothetical protein
MPIRKVFIKGAIMCGFFRTICFGVGYIHCHLGHLSYDFLKRYETDQGGQVGRGGSKGLGRSSRLQRPWNFF